MDPEKYKTKYVELAEISKSKLNFSRYIKNFRDNEEKNSMK